MMPGWKAYVWKEIQNLNNDQSGLFKGIKEDFLRQIEQQKAKHSHEEIWKT